MKRLLIAVFAVALALAPTAAFAAPGDRTDSILFRARGDLVVAAGDTAGTVIVIDGNAIIDGTVEHRVIVVNGDAIVTGTIKRDLTVISGDIVLQAGSQVRDVNSIRGDFTRAEGATVTGDIHERDSFAFLGWAGALFGFLFWLALSLALLVASLIFAAVGGRQLKRGAATMTGDVVNSVLAGVFIWIGVPLLAVLAMITIIGIPLGIGLLAFLLPAMGFLGYIVAGTRLGAAILRTPLESPEGHPFAAAVLGVGILQLVLLVPAVGGLIALFAGIWGASALAYTAFRAAGGKGFETPAAPGVTHTQQPAG